MLGIVQLAVRAPVVIFRLMAGVPVAPVTASMMLVRSLPRGMPLLIGSLTMPLCFVLPLLRAMTTLALL
jgi:hypothetical protein